MNTLKKQALLHKIYRNRYLLLLFLPCLVYYILFKYAPMWGILISFKDFKPFIGFSGSPWAGLKHFRNFFSSPDAWRIIRNTLQLGIYSLAWGFPFPVLFALLLNEVTSLRYKKLAQTVSYMPHFLSAVVVCGMITTFLSPIRGIINQLIGLAGIDPVNFLAQSGYFRTIYVVSDIWQQIGWGAIIYIAEISNVHVQLYEAAMMDAASKWRQIWSITLPCIAPTIVTMLILKTGAILEVGLEKVLLLQNPAIYETADIISTYVYRQGIAGSNMSYATAIGLFSSATNLILLLAANFLAKRFSETSIF